MAHDPRTDPRSVLARPTAPWRPHPGSVSGGAVDVSDDALLRLAGWLLAGTATLVFAAVALAAAAVFYGLATWRRWRWSPLAFTGLLGIVVVVAVSGPGDALHGHLLALREISQAQAPLGALLSHRWAAWLTAQLPLAVPLGAVLAAVGRRQVTRAARPGAGGGGEG